MDCIDEARIKRLEEEIDCLKDQLNKNKSAIDYINQQSIETLAVLMDIRKLIRDNF